MTEEEINEIKEEEYSHQSIGKLANFYLLFADETRLELISILSEKTLCVSDISKIMDMSQSRISHQLAILRKHNIVSYFREGKKMMYTLADNHIKDIFKMSVEHLSEQDDVLYIERKEKSN